jgi:hypothetical protein
MSILQPKGFTRRAAMAGIAAGSLGALNGQAAQFSDRRASHAVSPQLPAAFQDIAKRFTRYDVILEPDRDQAEWWAGAPTVVRDRNGVFWLAARMRNDHPTGPRGYELRLMRSEDGIRFRKVGEVLPASVNVAGFERPALTLDPNTGLLKLYACAPPNDEWSRWTILKFEDTDDLAKLKPGSLKPVITPRKPEHARDFPPAGYKDPVLFHDGSRYHCYVIGVMRGVERCYHFCSDDGEQWQPEGNPYQAVMELENWHNFSVRPASVLPLPVGYLFVYEGSHVAWHDANYNIATGLGFTFDLHQVIDLTPQSPLLLSSTPGDLYHTLRYSQWMMVGQELWVYAEVARPNRTNEVRLFRLPA